MTIAAAPPLVIRAGTTARFDLAPGDHLRLVDPEGLQPAILTIDDGPGEPLFGAGSPAGAEHAIMPVVPMRVAIAVPGGAMDPDAQDAPTDLHAHLTRAQPVDDLPPPLAEPVQDLRVPAASARAYRVKAGEYIQIIDVAGRQCSDFVAFDAAALDRGEEFGLDATVTRTLMGRSFSTPGLHARYFDARMKPLVEVVQDTVGRHDTFLLACTAKYYEDQGYPGHPSCSENFNHELAPLGVAARAGWPAINFFYNTFVAHDETIGMDEPWSRPGDYVLLRALTDLVCASSACPDDIDPAKDRKSVV